MSTTVATLYIQNAYYYLNLYNPCEAATKTCHLRSAFKIQSHFVNTNSGTLLLSDGVPPYQ